MKKIFPPDPETYLDHYLQDSAWEDAKKLFKIEIERENLEQKKRIAYFITFIMGIILYNQYANTYYVIEELVPGIFFILIMASITLRYYCQKSTNRIIEINERLRKRNFLASTNLDHMSRDEVLTLFKLEDTHP